MTKQYTLIPYTMDSLHTRIVKGVELGIKIQRIDHQTFEPINIKPSRSTVSKTGRTGERWWDIPLVEDVYLLTSVEGEGCEQVIITLYVVKEGEKWYRFEDRSIASVRSYFLDLFRKDQDTLDTFLEEDKP